MQKNATLFLKEGRERSIAQHHPWIFSGAIERIDGQPESGETVLVCSATGEPLGQAAFSKQSKILARMWTFDPYEPVTPHFFKQRLSQSIARRYDLVNEKTNAVRLVHAESDGLPGLVVDRYADWLVVQFLSAGAEYWRETIIKTLVEITGIENIYERSDVEVRHLEGLSERSGLLHGVEAPENVRIMENGLQFLVDIKLGQKTGFYLDQRSNRQLLRETSKTRRVLNCFCYTGGFSIYALAGGADEVISIDSSADALALAERNLRLNNSDESACTWIEADVFQGLRKMRDRGEKFDLIVLDPPKFAPTAAHAEKAARAYKDINLLGFKLLQPGGTLFTFSCSGGISQDLFQKIIASAALDAHVDASIVGYLHQGRDHPVALNFQEGEYLKGLVCLLR